MNKIANKLDRQLYSYTKFDRTKIDDLFNKAKSDEYSIYELKNYSQQNSIPLTVSDNNNNNLAHIILQNSNFKVKSEDFKLSIIKFLFDEGIDLCQKNSDGKTPLHLACKNQYGKIIQFIDSKNYNFNEVDNYGNLPIHDYFSGFIKLIETNLNKEIINIPREVKDNTQKLIEIKEKNI